MKCNADCLKLTLGMICGRCGWLIDHRPVGMTFELLANFRLAHEIVASMADGPRVRAADDADTIVKRMREIHLAEGSQDSITPEMIEAGAKVLDFCSEGCLGPHRPAQVAQAVYRAMTDARSQSTIPGSAASV